MPDTPVDLDALDAAHALTRQNLPFAGVGETHQQVLLRLRKVNTAREALVNAYPALSAELRALRAFAAQARAWCADEKAGYDGAIEILADLAAQGKP